MVSLLQTPPFPEYTRAFSISRAAALTLTDLFGENFDFVDTTEVSMGYLPVAINLLLMHLKRQLYQDCMVEFII